MKKHRPLSYRVCPESAELYLPENKRCSYTFIICKIQEKSIGVNEKTSAHLAVCLSA